MVRTTELERQTVSHAVSAELCGNRGGIRQGRRSKLAPGAKDVLPAEPQDATIPRRQDVRITAPRQQRVCVVTGFPQRPLRVLRTAVPRNGVDRPLPASNILHYRSEGWQLAAKLYRMQYMPFVVEVEQGLLGQSDEEFHQDIIYLRDEPGRDKAPRGSRADAATLGAKARRPPGRDGIPIVVREEVAQHAGDRGRLRDGGGLSCRAICARRMRNRRP